MPDLPPPEPTGDLTLLRSEMRGRNTKHAVYIRTIVRDENGTDWYFESAAFKFDLKPLKLEPVQLISVDGNLHLPPREDGEEPVELLYYYPAGDVDCVKAMNPNMEHLRAALYDVREVGELPAKLDTAKLPDGTVITF